MADTPFGASFGNPNRYMGSSPLGSIAQALKIGATVYGLDKSGATSFLDSLGIKQNNGVFSFNQKKPDATVPGAVAPSIDQVPQAGGPMTYGNQGAPIAGAVAPDGIAQVPQAGGPLFSNYNPTTMTNVYGSNTGTNKEFAPASQGSQVELPSPPPKTGMSILDGTVSLDNPNDWDPARDNSGYTQQLASGNEYQQQPGYGKTKKLMSSLFGMA
jgi:hypothetical protein